MVYFHLPLLLGVVYHDTYDEISFVSPDDAAMG